MTDFSLEKAAMARGCAAVCGCDEAGAGPLMGPVYAAAVILPVAQVPPRLCYRNLFYTGVTRARKLCVVAGRRGVGNSMMSNIRQNLRYSGLCALLHAGQPPQQLSTEGESP